MFIACAASGILYSDVVVEGNVSDTIFKQTATTWYIGGIFMKTITKLTVFFLSLSLLLNGCVSSNDKTKSPDKEDQAAKDDSYSVVVFDPVVFKDNKANKEPNTPKEKPFVLCGTELVAKRQYSDPIKDDHFRSFYNK